MGNTGTSWEDDSFHLRSELYDMAKRALKNYKAEQDQPSQASLHTIAYALAISSWSGGYSLDERLERIAQALEAGLRGEKITIWQVINILHTWAMDWERQRIGVTITHLDIMDVAHDRTTDEWHASIYSDTSKEMFDMVFTFDENFHVQLLSIELAKE